MSSESADVKVMHGGSVPELMNHLCGEYRWRPGESFSWLFIAPTVVAMPNELDLYNKGVDECRCSTKSCRLESL